MPRIGPADETAEGGTVVDQSQLCFLSAAELAPLIRTRAVSPVEIVESFLQRIDKLNDHLRAYLYIASDQALAAARAAEIDIAASGYRGPLHGIPVAYKDIYDVAGMPTTAASKVMAGYLAAEDCTVAARLRRAGAICLGKLNTHELASGSMEVFGTARNPWNPEMVPGGSSSGSGTALAAHLVTCATGSDTEGSMRNPASFCGIVGLSFITDSDAEPTAASIVSVQAMLAEARARLAAGVEPPVRPAPAEYRTWRRL
jgi:aspartyl-tRNA(Asn)/glutamyl-tRNA(Gln) amidotransferase subunit A